MKIIWNFLSSFFPVCGDAGELLLYLN